MLPTVSTAPIQLWVSSGVGISDHSFPPANNFDPISLRNSCVDSCPGAVRAVTSYPMVPIANNTLKRKTPKQTTIFFIPQIMKSVFMPKMKNRSIPKL